MSAASSPLLNARPMYGADLGTGRHDHDEAPTHDGAEVVHGEDVGGIGGRHHGHAVVAADDHHVVMPGRRLGDHAGLGEIHADGVEVDELEAHLLSHAPHQVGLGHQASAPSGCGRCSGGTPGAPPAPPPCRRATPGPHRPGPWPGAGTSPFRSGTQAAQSRIAAPPHAAPGRWRRPRPPDRQRSPHHHLATPDRGSGVIAPVRPTGRRRPPLDRLPGGCRLRDGLRGRSSPIRRWAGGWSRARGHRTRSPRRRSRAAAWADESSRSVAGSATGCSNGSAPTVSPASSHETPSATITSSDGSDDGASTVRSCQAAGSTSISAGGSGSDPVPTSASTMAFRRLRSSLLRRPLPPVVAEGSSCSATVAGGSATEPS